MNVLKIETLLTMEQKLLDSLKPLTLDNFNPVDGFTEKNIANFNKSKLVELISDYMMSEFIGDGKDMPVERFFKFQSELFRAISTLIDSCSVSSGNETE